MSRVDEHRRQLAGLADWEPYLRQHSGLPGPRANLELVQAVAEMGDLPRFVRFVGSNDEFLAACGAVGLGRLAAEGRLDLLPNLRRLASDPRWRVREAVAMGLQRLGDADMDRLLAEMEAWADGGPLEQRAAVAAPCEPRLLREPGHVRRVLAVLDRVTRSLAASGERRTEPFRALRQGLAYCWSVAAAALPGDGRQALDRWIGSEDPDVRWVMRQNLGRARIGRLGVDWVADRRARLDASTRPAMTTPPQWSGQPSRRTRSKP